MKSSSVGKNHTRRARILQKLAKLDFNILLLVIDKHKLSSQSGLKYKTSFYKFLYQRIYEHLRSTLADFVYIMMVWAAASSEWIRRVRKKEESKSKFV